MTDTPRVDRVKQAETARYVGFPIWKIEFIQWQDRLRSGGGLWIESAIGFAVVCVAVFGTVLVTGELMGGPALIVFSLLLAVLVGLSMNRWERWRVRRAWDRDGFEWPPNLPDGSV